MTPIEQFWADLIDSRRYMITEVYGAECASRYQPHHIEKEYFLKHNGTFSAHPSVTEHTAAFWEMCNQHYPHKRAAYERKLKSNWHSVQQTDEYKMRKREREQLKDYISDAINGNGKEADARTTEKESR